MPRYLMNGVYLLDVARDRPLTSLATFLDYTRQYYARYPALSLGHHPPLTSVAEVPMYALFGVSVGSARLVPLLSFVAAMAFLYLLVNEIYGSLVALLAAALFGTSPFVVLMSRSVLSEMPTLALVVASAYFLHRFCATERRLALAGFAFTTVLALYAKQLAIFVLPGFLFSAAISLGVRRLFKADVLLAVSAIAILALPLVPMTLVLSTTNVASTLAAFQGPQAGPAALVRSALAPQLTVPVLVLVAAGTARALAQRDRRPVLFLLWVASVFVLLLVAGTFEPERYSIYWVPALCTLAASIVAGWRTQAAKLMIVALMLIVIGLQGSAVGHEAHRPGADGYEDAARFVLQANPGPTVLFSGDIDTGFFTFFVRKHDVARRLVVLRADKILTTSLMRQPSVEDRIERPDEIYGILKTFGTRYVVIEDQPSVSRVLEWLRHELRSEKFVERKRIPIGTSDSRLRGTSLVVYEFTDAAPPDANAIVDLHVPLVGQSVSVRLSDLINRKYFEDLNESHPAR